MEIDLDQILYNFDGTPCLHDVTEVEERDKGMSKEVKDRDGNAILLVPTRLRDVFASSLIGAKMDKANWKKHAHRYYLAAKLYKGGTTKIDDEDVKLLKEVVMQQKPTIIIGQVHVIFEEAMENAKE